MTFSQTLSDAATEMWSGLLGFIPNFVVAVFVFVVGLFLGAALQRIVEKIVRVLWVDRLLESLKIKDIFEHSRIKVDISKAIGLIVNWFVVFAFLATATDIVGLPQVSDFLRSVVAYLPNVFVAAIILALGMLVATWVYKIVHAGVTASKFTKPEMVAGVVKWTIIVFSVIAALVQLKVAEDLLRTLFTGFVAMAAIAGGLAFGLGGKDEASRMIENLKKDISDR